LDIAITPPQRGPPPGRRGRPYWMCSFLARISYFYHFSMFHWYECNQYEPF
jgi:hypothetical protein